MKKVLSSLIVATLFSTATFAQTTNSPLKSTFDLTTKDFVDDFEDDDDVISNTLKSTKSALKPTSKYDATKLSQKSEVPDNIKQNYEEKDDGYLLEGFQLGVGVGVLGGANAHLGYRIPRRDYNFWKNRFGFRIDYNSWKPLESSIESYLEDNPIEVEDNEFTGMITGTNYGALVDFYPFGNTYFLGNFRISGGYYTGDFAIDTYMTKKGLNETFEMNNIEYKVIGDATLRASVEADVKGPYAGIGFDFQLLYGLKLYFDAGVVFIDNPKITTDLSGKGTLWAKSESSEYDIDELAGSLSGLSGYIDQLPDAYKDTVQDLVDNASPGATKVTDGEGYTYVGSVDASNNEAIQKLLEDTKNEYSDELDIITDSKIFPMVKVGLMLRF